MVRPTFYFCLVLITLGFTSDVHAEQVVSAVYQRVSTHAAVARRNWGHHGGSWGWGNPGFYNPWFGPQYFAGTWYERPYPDHLIYSNVRSRTVSAVPIENPNCPCDERAVDIMP